MDMECVECVGSVSPEQVAIRWDDTCTWFSRCHMANRQLI